MGNRSLRLLSWLCVAVYAVAGLALQGAAGSGGLGFGGLYIADGFSTFLKVVIYLSAAAATVLALPYMERSHEARFEYPVLLLLAATRSAEHTSELQSLMRISYAGFCLKTKTSSG